jgi:TPR repeat protein
MDTITKNKWKELLARAKAGSAEAQWEVGYYYESGAVDKSGNVLANTNLLKAQRWYTLAAEQGNESGQVALSNLLSSGEKVARDYRGAIYWAKRAIEQGSASAAFNLGTICRDQNKPEKAFHWYTRAVLMGDKDAMLVVGLCCLFGFGTKQDFASAHRHLKKLVASKSESVCKRTIENAHYWLAILHILAIGGTRRSVIRARTLLEYANADADHEQANDVLNIIGRSKYLAT